MRGLRDGWIKGRQDFTLHNETGVVIHERYISPHDSDNREEDVSGRDALPGVEVK